MPRRVRTGALLQSEQPDGTRRLYALKVAIKPFGCQRESPDVNFGHYFEVWAP
jgi:hypothetical protein